MTLPMLSSSNVSGQIYRFRNGKSFALEICKWQSIKHVHTFKANGWNLYEWITDKEVSGNIGEREGFQADRLNIFCYALLVREVEERFMVLSNHAEVVHQFMIRNNLLRQLERPIIDVSSIVNDAVFPEKAPEGRGGQYRISSLYANVEGFGRSFRTISLFGDDLANASLTRTIFPSINPYRASLRALKNDMEVLSVAAKGEISFYFRGEDSLSQVDVALSYMRKNNYIFWRTKK